MNGLSMNAITTIESLPDIAIADQIVEAIEVAEANGRADMGLMLRVLVVSGAFLHACDHEWNWAIHLIDRAKQPVPTSDWGHLRDGCIWRDAFCLLYAHDHNMHGPDGWYFKRGYADRDGFMAALGIDPTALPTRARIRLGPPAPLSEWNSIFVRSQVHIVQQLASLIDLFNEANLPADRLYEAKKIISMAISPTAIGEEVIALDEDLRAFYLTSNVMGWVEGLLDVGHAFHALAESKAAGWNIGRLSLPALMIQHYVAVKPLWVWPMPRRGTTQASKLDFERGRRIARHHLIHRLGLIYAWLKSSNHSDDKIIRDICGMVETAAIEVSVAIISDISKTCRELFRRINLSAFNAFHIRQPDNEAYINMMCDGIIEAGSVIDGISRSETENWTLEMVMEEAERLETLWPVEMSSKRIVFPVMEKNEDIDEYLMEFTRRLAQGKAKDIKATQFQWGEPAAIPRRDWLYGNHLVRGFLSLTVAPGATGKTSLMCADALACATGLPIVGSAVPNPLRVWLWNLEDPRDELQRRIVATASHFGIGPADIGDKLFLDSGRDQGLCLARHSRDGVVVLEPVVEALVLELLRRRIDLLVVDPFVSSHAVPENDNGAIDAVAKAWGRVADMALCSIELVHHLRKTGGMEATAESARGAVALVAAARSVRVLNRMTKEQAEKAGVSDEGCVYFSSFDDKNNLAPPPDKALWFRMVGINIANGDSVGVVEPWSWPDPFDEVTAADLFGVQQAVDGKHYRENPQAAEWVGKAVADVLGLDVDEKMAKHRIVFMIRTWIKNGALAVTSVKDKKGKSHPVIEVGKWASPT